MMVAIPAMLYGSESQAVKKQRIQKIIVIEMRMLRWMSSNTLSDRLGNECKMDQ